jgi:hypothetical protein
MYLTKINIKTGLLEIEEENDGILSIKAFREILIDEDLRFKKRSEFPGIHCLTAIALTVDYLSPVRFYSDKDRPFKAQEEVTGKRKVWDWPQEKIQLALKKYSDLQYDPTLVEGQIHYQRKVSMLERFKESEEKYGKGLKNKKGEEIIYESPAKIAAMLRVINTDIKEYEKQIQGKEVYEKSPVKNGYKLSRIEQKLEKKSSFYTEIR